jgi:hypothetical protein
MAGTLTELRARKQRYKLTMFQRLHRILLGAVVIIGVFFVVSSFSFSGRLAEGALFRRCPNENRVQYDQIMPRNRGNSVGGSLTDGSRFCILLHSLQYLICGGLRRIIEDMLLFFLFCYPNEAHFESFSTLAMSDEIAQSEEDAEDYDLEALEARSRVREDDDDDATLVGRREGLDSQSVGEDNVVFEIGDEEDDDDETPSKRRDRRSGDRRRVSREENGNAGATAD